jgi:hypothetical protein
MGKLDALGRATFHHIAEQSAVRVTNRELAWLAHIHRHGPQSSTALYDLTATTHRCRDTSLRALQRLRAGGVLSLPRQQRMTERAEFNPYIYDVTELGKGHLENRDLLEPTLRPSGNWWHAYGVGAITGAIEGCGVEKGIRYIPPQAILARARCDLPLPTPAGTVITAAPSGPFCWNMTVGLNRCLQRQHVKAWNENSIDTQLLHPAICIVDTTA